VRLLVPLLHTNTMEAAKINPREARSVSVFYLKVCNQQF